MMCDFCQYTHEYDCVESLRKKNEKLMLELTVYKKNRDDLVSESDDLGYKLAQVMAIAQAKIKKLMAVLEAARNVVSQYPFIHGKPVPAWIRNLNMALSYLDESNGKEGSRGH